MVYRIVCDILRVFHCASENWALADYAIFKKNHVHSILSDDYRILCFADILSDILQYFSPRFSHIFAMGRGGDVDSGGT